VRAAATRCPPRRDPAARGVTQLTLMKNLQDLKRHWGMSDRPPVQETRASRPAHADHAIEAILPGQLVSSEGGSCFVVETALDGKERHGRHPFRDLDRVTGGQMALITRDPDLAYMDVSRVVFLDT